MSYLVIVNRPGYLPDGDPREAEDLEDARSCLLAEIEATAGAHGLDRQLDALREALDFSEVEVGEPIGFGGYVHTIVEAEGDPSDYDDGQPDEAQEWHDYDPDC